jgi:hypothetical protein
LSTPTSWELSYDLNLARDHPMTNPHIQHVMPTRDRIHVDRVWGGRL